MPSIHIGEAVFSELTKEYGYNGAKQKVKELAQDHAEGLVDDE